MEVVTDSNVLISFFLEEDANHNKAIRFCEDVIRRKIKLIISTMTLPEICGAIIRRTKKESIAKIIKNKIEEWITNELVAVKELDTTRMRFASDFAIEFGLKGADAVVASLAKEFKLKFFTFDDEVKKKIENKVELFETTDSVIE